MNPLNETLRSVRVTREMISKKMEATFDIYELLKLENQRNRLEDEEKRVLEQLND